MQIARNLTRAVAVALNLPADGMDDLITYPCGDMALYFYPGVQHTTKTKLRPPGCTKGP
jgi:hypothetical protein